MVDVITIDNTKSPSGDQFNNFALQTLMALVYVARSSLVEDQVRALATAIQGTNAEIKSASDILVLCKKYRANEQSANSGGDDWTSSFSPFISKYGITFDSGTTNKDKWDANSQAVQGVLDQKTNKSSEQSTRLQNLNNKYTNAYEVITSFIKSIHEGRSGILDKIG